jgi:N-acetylneuraminate synthase
MKNIKIGAHWIGNNYPVFVIAEVGINHNGSFKLAKKMIEEAKNAGADCIKFQTHIAEKEMINTKLKPGNLSKKSLWEIIKSCELTEREEKEISNFCKKKKILFMSTPFSMEAVDRLEKIKVKGYKIGSGELTNLPLLYHIAKTNKPIILSTGMSTMNEISKAVKIFKKNKNPLALLQTSSTYPSKYNEIKLGLIEKFQKKFLVPIGISDHSIGIYTALGAVAKGASIVEKHFTLDKKMPGPDQNFSLNPNELSELIRGCKAIKSALGDVKTILPNEKQIIKFAHASVVSIKAMQKNEKFTIENISTKRPNTGSISATQFYKILGRKAKKPININYQLKWSDMI